MIEKLCERYNLNFEELGNVYFKESPNWKEDCTDPFIREIILDVDMHVSIFDWVKTQLRKVHTSGWMKWHV